MPAPEPPPLNDLEHLLVASASTPHDHALGQRFAQAVLRTSMGVAGTLHPGHEFTPFLVGTTAGTTSWRSPTRSGSSGSPRPCASTRRSRPSRSPATTRSSGWSRAASRC